jgi:hypothetical protein
MKTRWEARIPGAVFARLEDRRGGLGVEHKEGDGERELARLEAIPAGFRHLRQTRSVERYDSDCSHGLRDIAARSPDTRAHDAALHPHSQRLSSRDCDSRSGQRRLINESS